MTSFYDLSEITWMWFDLWALLLSVIGIGVTAYAVFQKRFKQAALSLLPYAFTYLLWQILTDINLGSGMAHANALVRRAAFLPWLCWVAGLLGSTVVITWLLVNGIRYDNSHITPRIIKMCADQMPCGICYWKDSGRVIFANRCMNKLCVSLIGQPLLNGNRFWEALSKDGYVTLDGRVWHFLYSKKMLDKEPLHELIAADVTEEREKTDALRNDTEELERVNRELQEYREKIAEIIRKQEILQAKVSIHDEMNHLMLRTVASESGDEEETADIFTLWKKNASLLFLQTRQDENLEERCLQLADHMNIRIEQSEGLPDCLAVEQRKFYYQALSEAIINAVKHAQATTLAISFSETKDRLSCVFENDGVIPEEVHYSGGLANLSILAEEQNAKICAKAGKTYQLIITFEIQGK